MKKILLLVIACVMIAAAAGSCGSASAIPAGNIANYGYVLVDGNDIYYTKVVITDVEYYGNIYKYNMATKKEEIVAETLIDFNNEMNAYLTMHNGYLYFLPYFLHGSIKESSPSIYRVKPDGRNIVPESLFEDESASITFMQIADKILYYYDEMEGILYSAKPDGTNKKVVCETLMESISISGGKAYFSDGDSLGSVSLKGGEPKLIFDFSELEDMIYLKDIIVSGNYIYYSDYFGEFIGRIRTNGKNNENIYIAESGEYVEFFNVSGDIVYIVAEDYGPEESYAVIAVSTRGGDAKVIVRDSENLGDILPLSIWGETVYFSGMPSDERMRPSEEKMDSDYIWFTVKKSGGNPVAWKPFSINDAEYLGVGEEPWDWDWGWDDDDWDENWDEE